MPILNKLITTALPFIPQAIVGQVAKRYIAGTRLTDGVRVVRDLNDRGMMATTDLLGEAVQDAEETQEVKRGILSILATIVRSKLDSNVSVKPTQLGLTIDKELGYRNIKKIVQTARSQKNFVRLDMEDASTVDATLAIYRRLRADGFENTGVVIQSYLHRSEADVRSLVRKKANIRLCKGIYDEPAAIAYKSRREIRDNYLKLLRIILDGGSYVGIATHDDFLIDEAYDCISKFGLKKNQYEFQMLLGVREKRRDEIAGRGHRLRIYVPFGKHWYAYSVRRLKENPRMAWYITKAIFVH
jgi:proline dehydrogenase